MDDAHRSQRFAPWLWLLLVLFAMRVLGQVLVAFLGVRWLPPMEEWMSGLLPYRYLLPSQLAILLLLGTVAADFGRGRGFFVEPRQAFARIAPVFGWIYLSSMVLRYAHSMTVHPERRWLGQTIPIVFHCVLATFVILFGRYHRGAVGGERGRGEADLKVRKRAPAAGGLLLLLFLLAGTALGGCVTASHLRRVAPPAAPCTVDPSLLGSWKGHRNTQLGPGWFRLRFECDCTYSWSAQLLWLRARAEGYYRIRDGALLLTDEGGTRTWPYVLTGDSLEIREAPTETDIYGRAGRTSCPLPG